MVSNVVELNIPPAHFKETYNGRSISYVFDPDRKAWHWFFVKPMKDLEFQDFAPTREAAVKAAHRMVDKVDPAIVT